LPPLKTSGRPFKEEYRKKGGVIVKGIENNPVPGDEIIGYITRGRGVSVHRKDCINIMNKTMWHTRLILLSWLMTGRRF